MADPVEWSRRTLKLLREQEHVDVTIVLANLNVEGSAPNDVMAYVRQLGNEAPELIVANQMYDPGMERYISELKWGHTTIVGTDRFAQHIGLATLSYRRVDGKVQLEQISVAQRRARDFEANARASGQLDQMMRSLCQDVDRPLGAARFAHPISYLDFLDYVMQVMRQWGRAEVSMLNLSSTADTPFPLDGGMTWEKLLRALRTQAAVGWVDLLGSRLIELAGPHVERADSRLRVLGLRKKGDEWQVNGRPVIQGERYRVVTTAFVADGGENLLKLAPTEPFKPRRMTLRGLMSRFFITGGASHDGDPSVDGDEDFPDLGAQWLLHGSADLGFALSNVMISNGSNGGRYSQPLLQRDQVTTLITELKLAAGASTSDHSIDADLQLQYGRTWTRNEKDSAEALDRIAATAIYVWHQIRHVFGQDRWYLPEPFAEGRLTTEFDRPAERDFHYVDFSGTVGVGLTLHPLFFLKMGAVLLVAPDATTSDIDPRPGVYFGYQLKRWLMFQETEHPLDLESRLDLLLTDVTSVKRRADLADEGVFFADALHSTDHDTSVVSL